MFAGLSPTPFVLVQGSGRADWTGKVHLGELPVYLAVFWILTQRFGIVGAALAWSLRTAVDLLLMMAMASKALRVGPRAAVAAKANASIAGHGI